MSKALNKLKGEELKREAFKICQEFLGSTWTKINFKDFNMSTVSGGLMNALYCCSISDEIVVNETPRHVLLRIYGPIQEDENAVVIEATVFMLLAERNLGPKLYGVFPKGRLEEYIPSTILSTDDIRKYSTTIAREMAKVHALDFPVRKVPDIVPRWTRRWIQEVENETMLTHQKSFPHKDFYTEEINWLEKEMEQSGSPVVYCHNDLQGGNILLRQDSADQESPDLVLIDFEFGGYNYRGFDIANQFNEWVFDYNTPDPPYFTSNVSKFPSKEEQAEFITAYLEQLVSEGRMKASDISEEREKMLQEITLFSMASYLIWSLWSEKMKFKSSLEFSHIEHAAVRRNIYKKLKEKLLKKTVRTCNGINE